MATGCQGAPADSGAEVAAASAPSEAANAARRFEAGGDAAAEAVENRRRDTPAAAPRLLDKVVPTPAAAAAAADGPIIEWQYAALQFDSAIYAPIGSLVIGSRLDSDIHAPICRLAFFGALDCALPPPPGPEHHPLRCLRLYKRKLKRGVVDRVEAGSGGSGTLDIVGKGLFKKEGVDMNQFAGLRVHTRAGQAAVIEGAFGKAGKFKASFLQLSACDGAVVAALLAEGAIDPPAAGAEGASGGGGGAGGSGGSGAPLVRPGHPLFLRYKKYVFGAGAGSDAKAVDRFEQD